MKRLAFLAATASLVVAPIANAQATRSGGALPGVGRLSSADVQRVSGPVSDANEATRRVLPFILLGLAGAVGIIVAVASGGNSTDSP